MGTLLAKQGIPLAKTWDWNWQTQSLSRNTHWSTSSMLFYEHHIAVSSQLALSEYLPRDPGIMTRGRVFFPAKKNTVRPEAGKEITH